MAATTPKNIGAISETATHMIAFVRKARVGTGLPLLVRCDVFCRRVTPDCRSRRVSATSTTASDSDLFMSKILPRLGARTSGFLMFFKAGETLRGGYAERGSPVGW